MRSDLGALFTSQHLCSLSADPPHRNNPQLPTPLCSLVLSGTGPHYTPSAPSQIPSLTVLVTLRALQYRRRWPQPRLARIGKR
jgi:hypothetical protein